jgi:tRNA threonylcarbamoyladenosine biosynthesis protein TsaB
VSFDSRCSAVGVNGAVDEPRSGRYPVDRESREPIIPRPFVTATPRRVLLLETSHQPGLVGLALGDRLVSQRHLESGRHNARDLSPAIAALLGEQGWAARDLDGVAVGRGPGSYTGLRVGIMSAKTLAYVTGCPLVALDTFAVIAAQSPPECRRIDVIADAQKEAVYAQSFARADEGWQTMGELRVVEFADWLASRDTAAWVGGPGLTRYRERLPVDVSLSPAECWSPGLDALLSLASRRLDAAERDDVYTLEPLYLRASSAELQWRERLGRTPA